MNMQKQKLMIEQVDKKLLQLKPMEKIIVPQKGWVSTIRTAMKMSLRQLGNRLKISAQSVKEIEEREANGSLTNLFSFLFVSCIDRAKTCLFSCQ
jgi:DNA-directed RNA polymerase sigma subunit (sigma70/sigma32)